MVRTVDRRRRPRHALVTLTAAIALVGSAAAPAQAHGSHGAPGPQRVASGLDNPRQMTVTGAGDVYVAEAGKGGTGAASCVTGPEGDEICLGSTGAVTRVTRKGWQSRVVQNLPSLAASGRFSGDRPLGRRVARRQVARRADRPGCGARRAHGPPRRGRTARHAAASPRSGRTGPGPSPNLAAHEASANPIHDPDSNPTSGLRVGNKFVITDAGGNTLVKASWGRVSTVAVFEDQLADAPPFLGLPPGTKIPAQAVPTAVVRGPDGAYYVAQLTGFPFPADMANIYRVVPGHAPTVWASGLTNVTSLAFDSRGSLYAVQLADDGLLAAPEDAPPVGSLVKVSRTGAHKVVAGGLVAPYGVAIRGRDAYVSTCSVCPGGGEVWRISL